MSPRLSGQPRLAPPSVAPCATWRISWHRMDRNYLKGRLGDRINAVLAAAGYNFGLLLRWLAELLRLIIHALVETVPAQNIA